MQHARLSALELTEVWSESDPERRARFAFPIHRGTGAAQSSVVYFTLEPGDHLGMHTDSAEETVLVVAGRVEAIVGDERGELETGELAVVPALVPHDVANIGDERAALVGFFTSSTLVSVFDDPFAPFGIRVVGTPRPSEEEAAIAVSSDATGTVVTHAV